MLQRVLGRFLLPEHISLQGATRYLRVKYRPALGSPLFGPATSPPDSKRARTQPPVDSPPTPATAAETGKFFLTICLLFSDSHFRQRPIFRPTLRLPRTGVP